MSRFGSDESELPIVPCSLSQAIEVDRIFSARARCHWKRTKTAACSDEGASLLTKDAPQTDVLDALPIPVNAAVTRRREEIMRTGVAQRADVEEDIIDAATLAELGWTRDPHNIVWRAPIDAGNVLGSAGVKICGAERGCLIDLRLAAALGAWAATEISRGFAQHEGVGSCATVISREGVEYRTQYLSFGCDGLKMQGAPGGTRRTLEGAARALVQGSRSYLLGANIDPHAHVLVWRARPELDSTGDYERRAVAYARFCFVQLLPGARLFEPRQADTMSSTPAS